MNKKKFVVLIAFVILLGLIQFIRPERNQQTNPSRYDIFHKTETEVTIVTTFQTSCYNCHSNRTVYPWYASVAPVSWIINNHVNEGKEHLNFSDWILYDKEKQIKKLMDIAEVLQEHEMPPKPYLWLHDEAKISDADRQLLLKWVEEKKEQVRYSLN
ncbi:MAG: cytochrome C [Bacteroidetes bacterium HGW-Bacteroidetes-1]|jgi:hypothetical protein|nr:MAG: cytochrome C [Bacteroidetes bacterium HGW-Bacteroidetes-1]